jgi:hypothetical protein
MVAGFFAIALAIENGQRRAEGRSPYSWDEARELIMPLGCLAARGLQDRITPSSWRPRSQMVRSFRVVAGPRR